MGGERGCTLVGRVRWGGWRGRGGPGGQEGEGVDGGGGVVDEDGGCAELG